MAGRRRTSTFEAIIDVVALFPWWVGVTLALALYAGLHHVATQPIPATPMDVKAIGAFAGQRLWQTLALFGQYVLPVACLIGAGLSAYGRRQRNHLHRTVAASPLAVPWKTCLGASSKCWSARYSNARGSRSRNGAATARTVVPT
jgi:restriction system protein